MSTSDRAGEVIDPAFDRRVESGRTLTRSCIATSLAGCFLIVGAGLQGTDVRSAMYCLVVSIPLLGIHYMVTSPGHERRYHISILMKVTTLLGLLAMAIGLGFLFERGAPGAGVLFAVGTFLCGVICMQSNDRAIARAKKSAAALKIAA
ncbi:MAG: hypothetical protein QM770_07495 [Tepidisphaeraceae bacterium]